MEDKIFYSNKYSNFASKAAKGCLVSLNYHVDIGKFDKIAFSVDICAFLNNIIPCEFFS